MQNNHSVMSMKFRQLILLFFVLNASITAKAQDTVIIDKIIAVVGSNIVMKSELEAQYMQMVSQGYGESEGAKCIMLEELLYQKLLLNQAQLDSVEVSDEQVDGEMDRRLRYFISQVGSQEALEDYYGKSIEEIKDDFRELIKEQLLSQSMQQQITAEVKVTPSEVRKYYNKIPKDSLPYINAQVEVGEIVKFPVANEDAVQDAKRRAEELYERVLNGTNLSTLAKLYSDDPGSAEKGGELGFFERGQMVPEFEAVAFNLQKGEVSEVFRSEYGFHFMELIERRGERVNVRHILITPKNTEADLDKAKVFLDSVYNLLENDSITFSKAVAEFSEAEESKNNDGLITNPATGGTKIEMDQLSMIDPSLFMVIDKLEVDEISKPVKTQGPKGNPVYKIFYLKSRSEPHKANLKDDYQQIQNAALADKQNRVINEWIKKKLRSTYVKLDEDYRECQFENTWLN